MKIWDFGEAMMRNKKLLLMACVGWVTQKFIHSHMRIMVVQHQGRDFLLKLQQCVLYASAFEQRVDLPSN